MTMMILSLIVPIIMGFLLCGLLVPYDLSDERYLPFKYFLSAGLGLGISSIFFFVYLLFFSRYTVGFIVSEAAVIILFISLLLFKKRRVISKIGPPSRPKSKISLPILLSFLIISLSAVYVFVCFSLRNPHGDWDAWAIWNLRARFIFRSGAEWKDAFSNLLSQSHTDYPLLIPGIISRCWYYIGNDTVIVPIMISFLFLSATAGLLISSISKISGRNQALMAGLVLLGTPFFIVEGASQYADVPLSFFFLATIVLFYIKDEFKEDKYRILLLSGLTAALAAWTKNEGILFVSSVILAHSVTVIFSRGLREYYREALPFFAALMPILFILLYFKINIASGSNIFSGQSLDLIIQRLTDFARYLKVGKAFVNKTFFFADGLLAGLFLYGLLLGRRITKKVASIIPYLIICCMILGYFLIYIITPRDLDWHLRTSLERLLLQLWPSFIFIFFVNIRSPEEMSS